MQQRVLEVGYPDDDAFGRDYRANLSNGGVFVETVDSLEPRELVLVRLRLDWCHRAIDLEGEVVHIVPLEMADVGGRPGVAVQFSIEPSEVRERLAPLCVDRGPAPLPSSEETRYAPRKAVRVLARIETEDAVLEGRTRNLSRSGVLIGIDAGEVEIGTPVRVVMQHPSGDEELAVAGVVMRAIKSGDRSVALAVHFDPIEAQRDTVERFVEAVQGAEHARRLGGISGPIAELGPQSIVQMFATTAPRGTILLRRGQEEGLLCFEGGLLRTARIGGVSGMKALIRMLSWREGTFEFHTSVEEQSGEPPISLDAAIFDAVRQIDEVERVDTSSFPLQARLVVARDRPDDCDDALSKVEAALLDLAGAGFTVQRALEVIPEPDPDIFRALSDLIDGGQLELH